MNFKNNYWRIRGENWRLFKNVFVEYVHKQMKPDDDSM